MQIIPLLSVLSLFSSGECYRKLKHFTRPLFLPNVIKDHVPIMNHHAESLVQALDETKGVVMEHMLNLLESTSVRTFLGK